MADLKPALKLLFECGVKLEVKMQTMSSAAVYFHRFFRIKSCTQFDPYLIGATCIYLAGKVEEDHVKLRDIINVFHLTVNKNKNPKPLEFNDFYFNLRNSIVQCELFILRVLTFDTHYIHPHSYLLHYLRSLLEWIGEEQATNVKIVQTCWTFLNDYYIDPRCIDNKPNCIAIAVIIIALRLNDIKVPYNDEACISWIKALDDDISNEEIWTVVSNILSIYEKECNEEITPQMNKEDINI